MTILDISSWRLCEPYETKSNGFMSISLCSYSSIYLSILVCSYLCNYPSFSFSLYLFIRVILFTSFYLILFISIYRQEVPTAHMLGYDIIGSKFVIQSCSYIHFQTNPLWKRMKPLIPTWSGLNSTAVFLQGWLWY